jgi:hypothetical protein
MPASKVARAITGCDVISMQLRTRPTRRSSAEGTPMAGPRCADRIRAPMRRRPQAGGSHRPRPIVRGARACAAKPIVSATLVQPLLHARLARCDAVHAVRLCSTRCTHCRPSDTGQHTRPRKRETRRPTAGSQRGTPNIGSRLRQQTASTGECKYRRVRHSHKQPDAHHCRVGCGSMRAHVRTGERARR